jgi:hypothetical protein
MDCAVVGGGGGDIASVAEISEDETALLGDE